LEVQVKLKNQIRTPLFRKSSSVRKDIIFGNAEICQGTEISYLVGFIDLTVIFCWTMYVLLHVTTTYAMKMA